MAEKRTSSPAGPQAAQAAQAALPYSIDSILSLPADKQHQHHLQQLQHLQHLQQIQQQQQQQQHQLQQWQHQQQLIAAANLAAVQQHQQQLQSPLGPLNPLAAAAAAASAPALQESPNFLRYFMAYMLLQQQQQAQQQQHHPQLHHLAHTPPSLQQMHAPAAAANYLAASLSRVSSNESPLKQLGSKSQSVFESIAALTNQRSSPIITSAASTPPQVQRESRVAQRHHHHSHSHHLNDRLSPRGACGSGGSAASSTSSSARAPGQKSSSQASARLDADTKKQRTSTNESDNQSTALSSLSNFVSESLAPILNETENGAKVSSKEKLLRLSGGSSSYGIDFLTGSTKSNSPSAIGTHQHRSSTASSHTTTKPQGNNGNISQHRKSTSLEPEEVRTCTTTSNNNGHSAANASGASNSTLDLISSAAQALKSTTGTIINTTLAKAPPELVQKQPAWVFCTRYSDRPSSGPRTRRAKSRDKKPKDSKATIDEKRPRTAFTSEQLDRLRQEFQENSYLDERRRKDLADRLGLNENQIKIWFQNKRAKMKKQNNQPNPLRGLLVAGGLYNHSTATSDCSDSPMTPDPDPEL